MIQAGLGEVHEVPVLVHGYAVPPVLAELLYDLGVLGGEPAGLVDFLRPRPQPMISCSCSADKVELIFTKCYCSLHYGDTFDNHDRARVHNNLGQALIVRDRREDAIRQFLFALQLNPIYDSAHYNIGTLLSESGQLDDALMHFRAALQLNPYNADYHNNIAIVLSKKGQIDEAIYHV